MTAGSSVQLHVDWALNTGSDTGGGGGGASGVAIVDMVLDREDGSTYLLGVMPAQGKTLVVCGTEIDTSTLVSSGYGITEIPFSVSCPRTVSIAI